MPFLQLRDARFPLGFGEVRVGSEGGAREVDVALPVLDGPAGGAGAGGGDVAVIEVLGDGSATVRAAGEGAGAVTVNGIAVGHQASPLLHGDRVGLAGIEVRYADEVQGGDTLTFGATDDDGPDAVASPAAVEARGGGRLLSLVDGREYMVGPRGLVIGRDAGCDIVIAAADVSRRHAEIRPAASGYEILDRSTNGVRVNGRRVRTNLALGRGDTVRVGREEFRFHADVEESSVPWVPSLQDTGSIRRVRPPTPVAGVPVLPIPPVEVRSVPGAASPPPGPVADASVPDAAARERSPAVAGDDAARRFTLPVWLVAVVLLAGLALVVVLRGGLPWS